MEVLAVKIEVGSGITASNSSLVKELDYEPGKFTISDHSIVKEIFFLDSVVLLLPAMANLKYALKSLG